MNCVIGVGGSCRGDGSVKGIDLSLRLIFALEVNEKDQSLITTLSFIYLFLSHSLFIITELR